MGSSTSSQSMSTWSGRHVAARGGGGSPNPSGGTGKPQAWRGGTGDGGGAAVGGSWEAALGGSFKPAAFPPCRSGRQARRAASADPMWPLRPAPARTPPRVCSCFAAAAAAGSGVAAGSRTRRPPTATTRPHSRPAGGSEERQRRGRERGVHAHCSVQAGVGRETRGQAGGWPAGPADLDSTAGGGGGFGAAADGSSMQGGQADSRAAPPTAHPGTQAFPATHPGHRVGDVLKGGALLGHLVGHLRVETKWGWPALLRRACAHSCSLS